MKKFFAALLLVFLQVVIFTGASYSAYYDEGNNGSSWNSAYIIDSIEDIELLNKRIRSSADIPGKYYKLGRNIDLSSYAKTLRISSFAGHFDGQGYTITVSSDKGLFYKVATMPSSDIAIRNLNVQGTIYSTTSTSGIVYELESGVIENCTFNGTVKSESRAGGIATILRGGIIRKCTVSGTISGESYSGGIAGSLYGGEIEDCEVRTGLKISVQNEAYFNYAGGIVGSMTRGYIRGCSSNANITANIVGGIVGVIGSNVNRAHITNNSYPGFDREVGSGIGYFDPYDGSEQPSQYNKPSGNSNSVYYEEGNDGNSWNTAYIIDSIEDIQLLNQRIKNSADLPGKYYKLGKDMDFSSYTKPLYISSFAGHFDGQGHTITVSSDRELFLKVNTAPSNDIAIRNLNVKGTIQRYLYAGGIVYKLESGVIENCTFNGNVRGESRAGGIAATVSGGIIRSCTVFGTISGENRSGGIAGSLLDGEIENCEVKTGSKISTHVDVFSGYAGGIVGYMTGGYVRGCSSNADITGRVVGGIVGWISSKVNRANITSNYYPGFDREVGSGMGYFEPDAEDNSDIENPDDYEDPYVPNEEPDIPDEEPDEPDEKTDDASDSAYYDEGNNGNNWNNAYIIDSVEDIRLLSQRIQNSTDAPGKYYKLAKDIDLSLYTSNTGTWLRISPFTGYFDGQGHTITISADSYSLFYTVHNPFSNDATIKNLNVKGSVRSVLSAGGIVSTLEAGVIENCTFEGAVEGNVTGGIAARVNEGIIRDCTFSETISGTQWSGGIAGSLTGGGIEDCEAKLGSKISVQDGAAFNYAGGIVGRMTGGYVKGCTSNANINAEVIGGIVGEITSAVNRANITNNYYTGAEREIGNGTGYFNPDDEPENKPDDEPDNKPDNEPDNKPDDEQDNNTDNEPGNKPDDEPDNKPDNQTSPDITPSPSNTNNTSSNSSSSGGGCNTGINILMLAGIFLIRKKFTN